MNTTANSVAAAQDAPLTPALSSALSRLQASRAQLRAAMMPPAEPPASSSGFAWPRRWRAMWRTWTRSGPVALAAGTAAHAVQSWWRSQPWHATTQLAGRAVMAETLPLVRRHPLWAVAVGAGLGAALVAARPWRWAAVNRSMRPIGGQVLNWAVAQLSQVPVQVALAALLAQFVSQRARGQAEAPAAATAPTNGVGEPHTPDAPDARDAPGRADAAVH